MNLWSWLIILGAVGSSVGFTLYGMGTSTLLVDPLLVSTGRILLWGGLLVLIVGFVAFKATDDPNKTR
ncbi:MAG: hypothetical protein KC442_23205 [Thermomicrobiales bacterium]|nr:hypothetical protein [Thermomicrobiales bacterium]